ncbi:MAG: hypothetical protein ACLFWR_13025 [Acidimicrobiales bacterium]
MDLVDSAIASVAARQHSVFALGQYVELGGNRKRALRRCDRGIWKQVHHSVFRIHGSATTVEQRLMAAVLDAGPGALVSHRAAVWLWGIPVPGGVPIELSVPRARVRSHRGVIWHRPTDLELARPTVRSAIPVTGLARSIVDLGAVEPALVRRAVWEGMRTHGLTWGDLIGVLVDHGRRGRPGVRALRTVVDQHYGQIVGDSRTEDRAFEILVDSGVVPIPERLVPVTCADGVEVTVDFMWPAYGVILEIFGVDHLLNERVQQVDALRLNQLELAGYSTLVYTGKMLRSPDALVSDVASRLRTRGWSGVLGS